MESWEAIRLYVSDVVADRLQARHITRGDVQRVIYHAETSGEKLCDTRSGRFLACYRAGEVSFWVEYSWCAQGFEVHNAYSHRMTGRQRPS
jgi:glutamate synthase (NADPH) small chain